MVRPSHRLAIAVPFALLAAIASASLTQTPTAQVGSRDSTAYEVLTKGLLGSKVFPLQFRSSRVRLDVRNLIMGPGKAANVPTPTRTILELRGGVVLATVNGTTEEHYPGDLWVVEKGSVVTLENRGDVVVIRALYLY